MITVRGLIAALKKMPQSAKVVVADHDHDDESGEINGPIPGPRSIVLAAPELVKRGYGVVIRL